MPFDRNVTREPERCVVLLKSNLLQTCETYIVTNNVSRCSRRTNTTNKLLAKNAFLSFQSLTFNRCLGVEAIGVVMRRFRLRWHGNMERKGNADYVKACNRFVVEGKAPVGRPRKTWQNTLLPACVCSKFTLGTSTTE